ncbi:MAG TPA: class I SAM-dependent rRNA methyltransferase [Bacteroidales bacterium]|jgi:23S rRNA (cytosine1962-C5)-methyltransferase|nr:class I SAM-dependent rRNA methyltransferase [Bacteroidales bacterium]
MIQLYLKPGKEQSVKRLHPWIFSGAIASYSGNPQEGDIVSVFSSTKEFLALGHYQKSSIAVRILSFSQEFIHQEFWNKRIASAFEYRKTIGLVDNLQTNCYRLVHGEGDNLPGLIIDFYNGVAVLQMHSVGMYKHMNNIVEACKTVLGERLQAVYNKSTSTLPFKAETDNVDGLVWGNVHTTQVHEYGNTFVIDWEKGQKTGFFIDQRENRKLVELYSKDKRVLNTFCYTGGFSVYALRGGAHQVVSVDSSLRAIELTNEAIELNFPLCSNHIAMTEDVFDFFQTNTQKFDVIILDPPAFAKHNSALNNALQGYKRLNMKAMEHLAPGGILFTFSCSQVVTKEDFRKSVFAAAANCKRSVRIIQQLTQPADHPISIFHPEGEYLKGLLLHIE